MSMTSIGLYKPECQLLHPNFAILLVSRWIAILEKLIDLESSSGAQRVPHQEMLSSLTSVLSLVIRNSTLK
jgi:hypothetical protein